MLPCACQVIGHRWGQNVIRTKKLYHWCFYYILTFSVIYYNCTGAQQYGIILYYMIKKNKNVVNNYSLYSSLYISFGSDEENLLDNHSLLDWRSFPFFSWS